MPNISQDGSVFTVEVVEVGQDYVEFEASWESSSHGFEYECYVRIKIDGFKTTTVASEEIGGANSTFYAYISGLDPNTEYTWTATLGWGDANGGKSFSSWAIVEGSFLTEKSFVAEPWTWTASNGFATTDQTQTAYNILIGTMPIDAGFSHYVWNDFVDKVMEVRGHVGDGTWDTVSGSYLSYQDCKVDAGDTLSAEIYNAIKLQIGQVVGTWPDVESGDNFYGWHIANLADKLNEAIEKLS